MTTITEFRKDIVEIHADLLSTREDVNSFEQLANEIASEYKVNPVIVRAIGRGSIPITLEVTDKANDKSKIFMREYVNLTQIKDIQRKRRKEMAELFNIELKVVAPITAWKAIHENRANKTQKNKQIKNKTNTKKVITKKKTSNPIKVITKPVTDHISKKQLKTNGKSNPEGGAHVDYDNEMKIEWRKKIIEFLLERSTLEQRKKMKILCLPGKKWLEVKQVYLDLGFLPENIVGFEKDKTAIPEFIANKPEGCRHETCDVIDYLKTCKEKFDVISLDFLGPISESYLDIFRYLHVNDRFFVFSNMMAKREGGKVQKFMQGYDGITRGIENNEYSTTGCSALSANLEYNELINKGINNPRELKIVRDNSFTLILQSVIGDRRMSNYSNLKQKINKIEDKYPDNKYGIDAITSVLISEIENALITSGYPKKLAGQIGTIFRSLFLRSINNFPFITYLKRYKYQSMIGKTKTPYVSDFFEFQIPNKLYEKLRHVNNFLVDCIDLFLSLSEKEDKGERNHFDFVIMDKNYSIVQKRMLKKSDKISLLFNKTLHCEITFGKLLQAIYTYEEEQKNSIIDKLGEKINEIIREEISV